MRYFDAHVLENRPLGAGYFVLRLAGCDSLQDSRPGQFVMLRGDWGRDPLLPRAFSLLQVGPGGHAEILAKTVGPGTALLERAPAGALISVLGPLGTSFPPAGPETIDLLVAGGVGLPPLFMQAQHAARRGLAARCELLYGGRSAHDLVLLEEMGAFGVPLHLTTEDGSAGLPGRVTAALEARITHHRRSAANPPLRIFSCGPNAMLWAVGRIGAQHGVETFLSLEERMACGIGVCLGCAIPARSRPFRYVCKDGPVFPAADVLDVAADDTPGDPPLCTP
jgi:dihydroorotate dehydrogenase electron transfer subunit